MLSRSNADSDGGSVTRIIRVVLVIRRSVRCRAGADGRAKSGRAEWHRRRLAGRTPGRGDRHVAARRTEGPGRQERQRRDVFVHGRGARSLSGAGEPAWFSVEDERGGVSRSGRPHRHRGGARDRPAAAGCRGHCRRNRAIAVEDRRARHRDRRGDDRSHQQARRARGASSGSGRADRAGWPAWWRHIALPSRR